MRKELDKTKELADIYQKTQESVSVLGRLQKERAISYIKKIEQKKIDALRKEISQS